MRAVTLALAALAVMPASAAAAPFGELPFRPVPNVAACLQPTGVPGELIRWTRGGVELLSARPDGLVAVGTVPLGASVGCPVVAGHSNGAAVLAAATKGGIRVALREPGGAWGAPVTLAGRNRYSPQVALNARGDAVVLWGEFEPATPFRSYAARRPAGGTFGAPERIRGTGEAASVTAAVSGGGETFVLVVGDDVRLTSAPAAAKLPPSRRLLRDGFGPGEIAAAEDGRVLIAAGAEGGLVLFEREPGGELVRRPRLTTVGNVTGVQLLEGGAATVSFGEETSVGVLVRSGPGAFGAPIVLQEEPPERPQNDSGTTLLTTFTSGDDELPYEPGTAVRFTRGADGRLLLAWSIDDGGVRTATIAGTEVVERQALATSVRDARGVTPLVLPGGGRALAWTDGVPVFSAPPYRGRLHFAVEGTPARAPAPAPRIQVGAPRDRTLRPAQDLVLPVRCSAACDVRGAIDDATTLDPGFTLTGAGSGRLRFSGFGSPIAPEREGPVKVRLRWSAPGSSGVTTRTVRVRLRRLPAPRLPRILDLRARRLAGGKVEVRWRTDGPAIDAYWFLLGARNRDPRRQGDIVTYGSVPPGDRRRYRVVLDDARAARYAVLTLSSLSGTGGRNRTVRIP